MQRLNKKRIFDIIITLFAATFWIPLLLLCALIILIFEGRPVFYISDRRVGDTIKRIIKFRTMVLNAESICNRKTAPISDDVRFLNIPTDSPLYTGVGRVIERYTLTEIPQLFHVLQGYMSLIGNRPLPENVVISLKKQFPQANDRFLTPAGMTGPVQLVGRANIRDRERLMLEMTYCRIANEAYSWRLDYFILLYTVLIALGIKHPLTVDETKELILKHSSFNYSYPEGLRRRSSDDGSSRKTAWSKDQRKSNKP